MIFEYDETKRQQVIASRKDDILYAAQIFAGKVLTRIDDRKEYGEIRYISLGMVENECILVVHTMRDNVTRLITAWKGGKDETEYYENNIT
jgi:uncharacterized DUF497 family protein